MIALVDSLRVQRTVLAEPDLSWRELGNGAEYELQRCTPVPGLGCVPAGVDVVGPRVTSWVDAAAVEPTIWYQVAATGECAR